MLCFPAACAYFVLIPTLPDADYISHAARPQSVRVLFQCSLSLMPTESDAFPPYSSYVLWCSFGLMLTDSDALLIFSPYVVRFDAPFIRCWIMRTLCSFIARMCSVYILTFVWHWLSWTPYSFAGRMCFVSDLASFDARLQVITFCSNVSYVGCWLCRTICFTTDCTYSFWCSLLHQMLTESDVSLIHSQTVRALFHSPTRSASRVVPSSMTD